jgi:septal ring factor EnvC (AmiA/AmiB activator)
MKKYAIVLALLLSLGFARAADAPTFPAESKVKILKIQLQQEQMKSEYGTLQARMAEIQKQFPATQTELQAAVEEAYKTAKLDKKDWNVDLQKLEWVAMPKPEPKKP